ncbi:MAG: uroporphyrinogen-III synthase [Chlorobi bacterium]|nr:uroporphyrinogen-III synthase [Chlorobiota bacterium]
MGRSKKKTGTTRAKTKKQVKKENTIPQGKDKESEIKDVELWTGIKPEDRKKPIKKILLPLSDERASAYKSLEKKYDVEIIFQPYLNIEPFSLKEFRRQKIKLNEYPTIIFTNRTAVDLFFQFSEKLNQPMPAETKYLCLTEQIAYYLQKYIPFRKRRIGWGTGDVESMAEVGKERFAEHQPMLYPCSDKPNEALIEAFKKRGIEVVPASMYRTIYCELPVKPQDVDIIAFFTPKDVQAIATNYPEFIQNQGDILVATFGKRTEEEAKNLGLRVDIKVPIGKFTSMAMILDEYLKQWHKAHGEE